MGWPEKKTYEDGMKLYPRDGEEPLEIRFIDTAPTPYYTHYVDGKRTKCGGDDCANCVAGVTKQTKYTILVMDMKDGKMKALNGTEAFFRVLHSTINLCGGINGYIFKIKTTGKKLHTKYTVVPMPDTNYKKADISIPF